ncbi:MAG: WxL domain-containing protein, partial [Vagococcus sp.]
TPDGPDNFSSFGLPTSYNTSTIMWNTPDRDHYANAPWLYKPYQNNSIHGAGMEKDGYQPNQIVVPNQFSNKNETGVTMKWDEVTLNPGEYKDFTYDVQLMGDFGILYLFNNTNPDKENTYSAGDIVKFEPSGNWNKEDYKLKEGTIETTVSEYVDLKENDDVIVEANKTSGDGLEAVEIKRVKVKDVYDETTRKISVPVSKEEVEAIETDVSSMGIDFYGQLIESSSNQRVYQQATINFVDSKDNHVYTRTQPIEFDVDDFEWVAPDVYELSVDKHVSEDVAFVGDTVHYTVNASNTAKSTESIDSLVLTDKMPEGLSKPQQVKIDNQLINENQIKWDSNKREWELPLGEIAKGNSKQITYESVIEKGSKDEVKTNVVTFGSEETEEWTVTDEASFIIDEKINWTVSFNSLGGSPITSQVVEDGQKVEVPKNPEDEQREFKGWYTTENLTILYDFNQPVTDNITLYAKWRSSIVDPIDGDKVIEPTNPVNKTTEDLRIQYVSDFNFGENRNDLSELSVKANEDSVIGEKNVKRKVPAFVSIIDDRPQTTRISSPWELRVKNTSFKDSSGHELPDTSIILSDLNFQGQRKNPKVTSGEIDISNKVQKIASSDNQPEGTSWSLALGKLDNEKTTGVTFYSPSGFYKNATQYNSIVDWQLVPKINE